MVRRRPGLLQFAKLLLIARRSKIVGKQHRAGRKQQYCNRNHAQGLHAALRVKPRWAASEISVAQTVTKVTIMVRFTSKGRSRDCAACQASWPIPATSLTTSIGSS